jgi:hypothetical protein
MRRTISPRPIEYPPLKKAILLAAMPNYEAQGDGSLIAHLDFEKLRSRWGTATMNINDAFSTYFGDEARIINSKNQLSNYIK